MLLLTDRVLELYWTSALANIRGVAVNVDARADEV